MAGVLADRLGRTTITIAALAVSGSCALLVGWLFGAQPALLVPLCLLWGLAVSPDSAQFSAAASELSRPEYIGTALTLQTCLGFLLTLVTIRLVPTLEPWAGWGWAFAALALGPAVGIWAMSQPAAPARGHPLRRAIDLNDTPPRNPSPTRSSPCSARPSPAASTSRSPSRWRTSSRRTTSTATWRPSSTWASSATGRGSCYAERGRPSIDPVVFFKLQLVMFFEGIRSERKLIETASLNLAHRWYLGYALDEALPDHSSLTRIRQRLGIDIFQRFFEQVVDLCQEAGLVWGRELYFDATKVAGQRRPRLPRPALLPRGQDPRRRPLRRRCRRQPLPRTSRTASCGRPARPGCVRLPTRAC